MDKLAYIYALTDPDTGHVRYIGKTINLKDRYRQHMLPSQLSLNQKRANWLRSLVKKGKAPKMEALETVSDEYWQDRECYWIAFYRALIGRKLTNTAEGGNGGTKSENFHAQWRASISAAKRGIPRPPETIAKMSAAHKGKRPSAQCEEARLKAIVGKPMSDEAKSKMSKAHKGNRRAKKHDYIATSPDGTEYKVESLIEFCNAHGLGRAHMSKVAHGHPSYKQHKGWKCRFA